MKVTLIVSQIQKSLKYLNFIEIKYTKCEIIFI